MLLAVRLIRRYIARVRNASSSPVRTLIPPKESCRRVFVLDDDSGKMPGQSD